MSENGDIIEFECPHCHCSTSRFVKTSFGLEGGICTNCGERTFINRPDIINLVRCPYCNSSNTKKISTASKVGKVALFGVFAAGSVSKTWHCNSCGSNFG